MEAASRRIGALEQQCSQSRSPGLALTPCSAAGCSDDTAYAVALPEVLATSKFDVRRSSYCPERLVSGYDAPDDSIATLYDNFEVSCTRYADVPFLGRRKKKADGTLADSYLWTTYAEAGSLRTALGSAFVSLGVTRGDTVGIYSINCPEWLLVDHACHAYSFTSVPLYDTLGPDAVRYICTHAELSVVACNREVLPVMVQCLPQASTLKVLVVWGVAPDEVPATPPGSSCRILTLDQLIDIGGRGTHQHDPPAAEDLATICYTSGTTGVPKGVMLTHANLIANSAGIMPFVPFQSGETYVSYLPLAHIYERVNLINCVHTGVSIGFYSGDVAALLDDIQILKPSVFCSVPRLWNRIYDRVMSAIRAGSPLSRTLFEAAYSSKKAALAKGDLTGGRMGAFWDRLVFSKIKARLGGNVRLLVTGASPISTEVFEFLRICFGATVLEGYGMTESSCTISLTRPGDATSGHVGAPSPACEIKLEDIPEMGYTNADAPQPRGEICVRGPIVFKGYYKDPGQTAEVLDEAGWLHTGDVGTWLPGGRLKIIDRKKNLFKLAQGEYVAPEKIEAVYVRSPWVMQSFVYGESLRDTLVAVVVLDPEFALPWASSHGRAAASLPALCEDREVAALVLDSMTSEGSSAGLKGFEQVSAIHLVAEPFSVENGMLTPSFKLKRPQAKAAYQEAIATMYANLEAASR